MTKTQATAYYQQLGGLVVQMNHTLLDMLAKVSIDHPVDWDAYLGLVLLAYQRKINAQPEPFPAVLCSEKTFGRIYHCAVSEKLSLNNGIVVAIKSNGRVGSRKCCFARPKGTMKMLVSGSGDIKISKDGNVLLNEMQIKVPTASMIAKTSTAQNDITGDGTTSVVMLIGELLKQAENYITEGVHPSVICDGLEMGKNRCLKRACLAVGGNEVCLPLDKDLLLKVAGTALRTKVAPELADHLTEIVVDAVLTIRRLDRPIDLLMVEVMTMQHCTEMDTKLIRGLVLDHGVRHPDMKKLVRNAYILACNVSLEFEKPEVNVKALYKNAEEREKLLASEREFIIKRVQKIIDLKRKVCDLETLNDNVERNFVVINQKGIDPISLDLLPRQVFLH
ncbi:T-complex protein 1 subunit zeta [Trichinella pseudospiralis]